MNNFQLDKRLEADCILLGYLNDVVKKSSLQSQGKEAASVLLLMNNKDFPWLVIVPIDVYAIDIDELPERQQLQMLKEVNVLSSFLKRHYKVDKMNFASIGNIVNQMHFHLVARNEQDISWPGVVWGAKAINQYNKEQVEELKNLLNKEIDFFNLNINN